MFLWSLQLAVAASVALNKRTVVRSAAGIGKSYLSAVIVCWWVTTHPVNEVYVWTTAPGGDQVSGVLWEEIRKLHTRLKLPGKVGLDDKWRIGGILVAQGRKPADKAAGSDEDPDTGQGFHRRYLLVVLDDAGGLDTWLWTAAENITTGDDCRIFATGNPDHAGSRFAQVCDNHPLWTHFKASVFQSPNFTGEKVPDELLRVLTNRQWQEARLLDWGKDDRRYISKVLGGVPEGPPRPGHPRGRARRLLHGRAARRVRAGAGGARRRRRRRLRPHRHPRAPRHESRPPLGDPHERLRGRGPPRGPGREGDGRGDRSTSTATASAGHWSATCVKTLLRAEGLDGVTVNTVMVGGASSLPLVYGNLKAELWFVIGRDGSRNQEWDLSGMAEAETAKTELLAPRWRQDAKGRIFIEEKADVIARTGHSPDDADALLLSLLRAHATGSRGTGRHSGAGKLRK